MYKHITFYFTNMCCKEYRLVSQLMWDIRIFSDSKIHSAELLCGLSKIQIFHHTQILLNFL